MMLGGGGLVFQIHWQHPLALLALIFGYACFIAALFAVLVALMPDERRAGVLNNVAGMALGLVGGCAFPAQPTAGVSARAHHAADAQQLVRGHRAQSSIQQPGRRLGNRARLNSRSAA